jgi:hypothetical protein
LLRATHEDLSVRYSSLRGRESQRARSDPQFAATQNV